MIRNKITDKEMSEIITKVQTKPVLYNGQQLPLTSVNDRIFEILLYQIFKHRIDSDDYRLKNKYDNIYLMQGVGERGRDCFLTKKGSNVGIIQCKQINKNITKPEALKEILKFSINYILDRSLITDVNNFTYYLCVSKGFAETCINLLANFNNNYKKENIRGYCEELINKYQSFKHLKYDEIEQKLIFVLNKMNVEIIQPADINQLLFENEKIIKYFFRVLTVTDNTLLDGIIENYLSPILNKLYPKKDRKSVDFSYRFKEYLQRVYNYYSSSKTLVFGNQQKKLEDFYYPLNLECAVDNIDDKKITISTSKYEESFVPKFKKVIIVDNGGMGKSTIMKWLFLSIIKQRKGIPIFIELRKIKSVKTIIDEIITELNPLDESFDREIVHKLISEGNFVFFFDGYDEIADEDRERVTSDLQNFISKSERNLFIITSRPETALNTFSDFKEFKVKKLRKIEAFELIKRIGNNSDKSTRLIKKLEEDGIQNIDEFLQSPLLVSLLYKKFEHRENLPLHLQEFYYDVFEALFQDHDLTKGDSFIRSKKTKLAFSEFFQVLRELGFYTLKKGEVEYNHAVLSKYLQEISKRLPNIKFKPHDFIEDLVKAVPLFSKEGLQFRWAHKSFQEYFTAEFICRDTKEQQIEILNKMFYSDKIDKYNFVLSLCYDIDFKPFKTGVILPFVKDFINHYDNSFDTYDNDHVITNDIDILKTLTFNYSYLILKERDKSQIDSILKTFNQKTRVEHIENLPDFILSNHRLNLVSFGNFIVLVSGSKNNLIDILEKKKSNLLKTFKISKISKQHLSKQNVLDKMPKFLIINNNNTELIKDANILSISNNIIINQVHGNYLDIKKCRKLLEDHENEKSKNNSDYYLSGF